MRTAAGETAFQVTLKNCSGEARGEPGYIGVLQQKAGNWERQKIVKENQVSQVKEFSAFLWMGRRTSLGSLKSFL